VADDVASRKRESSRSSKYKLTSSQTSVPIFTTHHRSRTEDSYQSDCMGNQKGEKRKEEFRGHSQRLVRNRYVLRLDGVKPPQHLNWRYWSSSRAATGSSCRSTAAALTNIFVGMLMLSMLGIYGGMFYYVRRASRALKMKQEVQEEPDQRENDEKPEEDKQRTTWISWSRTKR
jgi:hypothetical protein